MSKRGYVGEVRLRGEDEENIGTPIRDEWQVDGTTLLLETALANIRMEIAEDVSLGKVKPFVEGEPIGMMVKPVKRKVKHETPKQRWYRRQEELAELRTQNDRAIARILEG